MYIIFGRDSCGYCKNSQSTLKKKKIKYKFYDIDGDKYSSYTTSIPDDFNTVPRIIRETPKCKIFIGGYDSLISHLRNLKKTKKKRKTIRKKKYTRK
jgi:glutaredoxin